MSFSDFVRSLEPSGEPPDDALDELWTELRRVLRRALQRRGLWDRPPSYLGVTGYPTWTTSETANRRGLPARGADALDELSTDFYVEVFVQRLPNLRRYAARGDSLVRVVHLAANQFLQERQRQSDPLGDRVFRWLRAALRRAVEGRRLDVLEGGGKIHNGTVFRLDAGTKADPATEEVLAPHVRRWNDELFVDWVSARGPAAAELTARLEACILGLPEAGIEVFTFKALVDALKRDVRDRQAALLGDPGEAAISEDPLRADEERERIHELSECVEAGIRDGGGQRRTRDQLSKLWRFLVDFALAAIDPEVARGARSTLAAALQQDDLPSHRQLSRLLGIRHDRFPALLARLRKEVERCSGALAGAGPPLGGESGGTSNTDTLEGRARARGPEANVDHTRDLRQELKRLTADAYRREAPVAAAANGPGPGDLYHLEGCPEPGIEWLVVDVDATEAESLVVPADTMSWIGTADVAVTGEPAIGLLSLRCDLGLRLGREILTAGRRAGALSAADVERVGSHRRRLFAGEAVHSAEAQEIDLDPDYRDWRRSLEGARNAVARVYGGRIEVIPAVGGKLLPMKPVKRRPEWRWAVAASVAAVAGAAFLANLALSEISDLRARLEAERQPEAAVPWLLAPLGTQRGTAERLVVPPGARSIALLLDALNGDRVEIADAAGAEVWSGVVERIDSADEALVQLPAALMPPGEYDVRVWRGDALRIEFSVRIEAP